MKTIRLLILLFFIPLTFHAQKTLTGLWIGSLTNDSTTVRQDQSFEIALTQYKQKVYGYSRSTFIVNDTLYYIVKRVKGTIDGNICEVKDDEIISYNFRGKIDKKVHVTTTFRMNNQDSTWYLAGEWRTNQTRNFYAISGKVDLKDEPDVQKSKIFPHLEELNLAKDVPFYAEAKKASAPPVIDNKSLASAKKEPEKNQTKKENTASRLSSLASSKPEKQTTSTNLVQNPPVTQEPQTTTVASVKPVEEKNKEQESIASNQENKPSVAVNKPVQEKKDVSSESLHPVIKKQDPPATVSNTTTETVAETKKQDNPPVATVSEIKKPAETKKQDNIPATATAIAAVKKTEPVLVTAAVHVNERKTTAVQQVNFQSDSLQLALYDNGEIDGDTVSVLMNGELILAKQGLKASAIRKTIYITPGQNEFTLVLYAENLGKYAPNTGLLVIYDGEERYQLRFSADLQQNAAVIFQRKK